MSVFGRISLAAIAVIAACTGAHAQQGYFAPTVTPNRPVEPELVGVWERQRPEYQAEGVRVGSFILLPSLELIGGYDDNLYATKLRKTGDWVGKARPELLFKSDWTVHGLELYAGAEFLGYPDHARDDQVNGRAGFRGYLDATRDTRFRYFFDWAKQHEDRGTTGLFAGSAVALLNHPVELDTLSGGIAIDQRFNRWLVSASGTLAKIEYQDTFFGSTRVDQSFRDVNIASTRLRVGHDLSATSLVYVEGGYERRDYELRAFDSDSVRVVAGVSGAVTRLVHGDVYAGWERRTFDINAISSVDNFTYGGALTWYSTPLMTVAIYGERTINETAFQNFGTFIQSRIGTRIDYEALRNLILTGRLGYEWDDYRNTSRNDRIFAAGVTATYLINRHANFALDYRFTDRDSSLNGFDYQRNIVAGTLRLQY